MPPVNHSQRNSEDEQKTKDYPPLKPYTEKILVIVKTAPRPSVKYREIVCTAGITEKGKWIRLFPIDYRYMNFLKRFSKYQWINVEIEKNSKDLRIDSYRPNLRTLKPLKKLTTKRDWEERKKIVLPTVSPSLEAIKEDFRKKQTSLGIFKPKNIIDLTIERENDEWSTRQKKVLTQLVLFGQQPKKLEKVPFKFSYKFFCDESCCKGHKLQIIDWEIYELYRNIKNNYPYEMDVVLEKVKQKWFYEMCSPNRDTYLIVGSRHPFPSFIVLGVFWPPKAKSKYRATLSLYKNCGHSQNLFSFTR